MSAYDDNSDEISAEMGFRTTLLPRLKGAILLKSSVYEEIERSLSAMPQAVVIVILVSIANSFYQGFTDENVLQGFLVGVISALIVWTLIALIFFLIGNTFTDSASWGEVVRVTGYAQTPGLLFPLAMIPGAIFPEVGYAIKTGTGLYVAIWLWQWAALLVGLRLAFELKSFLRLIPMILVFVIVVYFMSKTVFN